MVVDRFRLRFGPFLQITKASSWLFYFCWLVSYWAQRLPYLLGCLGLSLFVASLLRDRLARRHPGASVERPPVHAGVER